MRIALVCGLAAGLVASPALAQSPAQPRTRPAAAAPGTPAVNPSGQNETARREAQERERRWDDRMRRVTRSMCDRC